MMLFVVKCKMWINTSVLQMITFDHFKNKKQL